MSVSTINPSAQAERQVANRPRKTTIADHYTPILVALSGRDAVSYEAAIGHWLNDFKEACFIPDRSLGRYGIRPNPAFREDPHFALLADLCEKPSDTATGPVLNSLYGDLYHNEKTAPYIADGVFSKFDDTGALKNAFKQTTGKLSHWIRDPAVLDTLTEHLDVLKPITNVVPLVTKPAEGSTKRQPCPFV